MNKFHAIQLIKTAMQDLGVDVTDERPPEWVIKAIMRAYREGYEDGYDRAVAIGAQD